ncbi:hypothetical protein C8F04DRAFT_1074805 [Mycena alexandri]|uniref:F-box domain-containing protein n=1 Tax=Mycena alexandri TaxID=1745969 RepID=A0AAD6X894_9AGAR|nr:hypothetical protein C8F04DRAFT_1074805 [Mycena alexandri]
MANDEPLRQAIHLPDEIISEILSPALRVSDEAFSYISTISGKKSPFMTFTESTSALLVVCKAWLRVATPLLYNVVILRSKAQAQALAATLTANPALGAFIRKLRVEGGFAISMLKILQTSGNITDLFLSAEFASGDNACGLCRGLPLLDPVQVIVAKATLWGRTSQDALKLLHTLEKCIPAWKKLAVFEFPDSLCEMTDIPKALSRAPNLATFVILDPEYFLQRVAGYMELVATNPSLKRIRINPTESPYQSLYQSRAAFYHHVERNKTLNALFDQADVTSDPPSDLTQIENLPSTTPFVYPAQLAADPAQEDAIWSRVLYFALYNDPSKPRGLSYRPSLATPLLVCKLFARLGIPHLYKSPVLNSPKALNSFASELGLKPLLFQHIRGLTIKIDPMGASFSESFENIVASIPKLRELSATKAFPLRWDAFYDLGESTGSSIELFRGISIPRREAASPLVFTLFPQLQEFEWNSGTTFKDEPEVDTFSLLVKLTVTIFDESFLNLLSQMELPSLQTVEFSAHSIGGARFFQKHGGKLRDLTLSAFQIEDPTLAIWRSCPSMKTLGVYSGAKFPALFSFLTTDQTHTTLERIVFKNPGYLSSYRMGQTQKKALKKAMTALLASSSAFPALREVMHPSCEWPTSEPEISKSPWVNWAESFLERSVHLVGPKGVHWRPRLKFVTKSKK